MIALLYSLDAIDYSRGGPSLPSPNLSPQVHLFTGKSQIEANIWLSPNEKNRSLYLQNLHVTGWKSSPRIET